MAETILDRLILWLRVHQRWVLLGAVAFQVLVLGSMVAGRSAVLWSGETILLRVIPVDPRDLFRGDYVILGYEIGRVPPEGIEGLPNPLPRAERPRWEGWFVYVTLEPEEDGAHYSRGRVSTRPPTDGSRYIAGRLDASGRIVFGIESYFVQEGKGKVYEEAIREHRLSAEVALAPDGQATLRGLRIEPASG